MRPLTSYTAFLDSAFEIDHTLRPSAAFGLPPQETIAPIP